MGSTQMPLLFSADVLCSISNSVILDMQVVNNANLEAISFPYLLAPLSSGSHAKLNLKKKKNLDYWKRTSTFKAIFVQTA